MGGAGRGVGPGAQGAEPGAGVRGADHGQRAGLVPSYIACTDPGRDGVDVFSFGSAYLGPQTHPFTVAGDPAEPRFEVRNLNLVQAQQRL